MEVISRVPAPPHLDLPCDLRNLHETCHDECSRTGPLECVKKTVYFVRHGQALHNVVEEQVKRTASEEARTLGHAEGSPEFDAFLKQARLAALRDDELIDPALSDLGKEQIMGASRSFEGFSVGEKETRTLYPTLVLVSPLLRTMQSAALMFPDHPNMRVAEVLRERKTGLPCDEVSPTNAGGPMSPKGRSMSPSSTMDFDERSMSPASIATCVSMMSSTTCVPEGVEDATALRARTAGIAELLLAVEDDVICVVSHKGWLRELERGPMGRRGAKEFKPGEIRAFEVTVRPDGGIEAELLPNSTPKSDAVSVVIEGGSPDDAAPFANAGVDKAP